VRQELEAAEAALAAHFGIQRNAREILCDMEAAGLLASDPRVMRWRLALTAYRDAMGDI
jgi:DNA-binding IclR family transcriptional regulator